VARSSSRTERSSRAARALLLSPVVVLFAAATRLIIVIVVVSAYSVLLVNAIYRIPFDGGIMSDTLRRPWLPAEEVRVTGSNDPLVGYVLSTSDGWHVLLNNDPRQIIYIRSVLVTARTVCHIEQPGKFHEPLIKLEGAEPPPISTCGQ